MLGADLDAADKVTSLLLIRQTGLTNGNAYAIKCDLCILDALAVILIIHMPHPWVEDEPKKGLNHRKHQIGMNLQQGQLCTIAILHVQVT